jgi:hypothetical protein
MIKPLAPETRAWLLQAAKFEGAAAAQVLEHLLERMDAQEARDAEDANRWASVRHSMHRLRERIEALEQRPIPGFVDLAAPAPEPAPVIAPYGQTAEQARRGRAGELGKAAADASIAAVLAAQPPAAPPAAPAGELVERVADAIGDAAARLYDDLPPAELNRIDARAAIREVAAWLDSVGNKGSADELRREAAR